MRKLTIGILAAAMLLVAVPTSLAAERSVSDAIRIHTRYFNLRDRMLACRLDRIWHTLPADSLRACRTMDSRYVLYTTYGEDSDYQIHCRTKRYCLATPERMPPADKPIPAGAHIVR
jgi:hypothetical protein